MWQKHLDFMREHFSENWRDRLVVVLQLMFIIALLPAIFGNEKPGFWTSFPTAIAVSIFAYIYATILWWWTVSVTSVLALEWWILVYQVI